MKKKNKKIWEIMSNFIGQTPKSHRIFQMGAHKKRAHWSANRKKDENSELTRFWSFYRVEIPWFAYIINDIQTNAHNKFTTSMYLSKNTLLIWWQFLNGLCEIFSVHSFIYFIFVYQLCVTQQQSIRNDSVYNFDS